MEYIAQGGPMDGKMLLRRDMSGSKGILLIDKPNDRCWLYDWDSRDLVFVCRDPEGMKVHTEGPDNRWRAADESEYDVVALGAGEV
jgi:hypothetical protein